MVSLNNELKSSMKIKNKRLFPSLINVTKPVQNIIQTKYKIHDEGLAFSYFKERFFKGEYIGDAHVFKTDSIGHVVKIDPRFFAIVGMQNNTIFFVTSNRHDFKLLESETETVIKVGKKEIDVSKIEITEHFKQNMMDRYKISEDLVSQLFRDALVNGVYICRTISKEDRNPAHLFFGDGKMIFISLDFKAAITTFQPISSINSTAFLESTKKKIVEMLMKDARKMAKEEEKLYSLLEKTKLENELKIAELRLDIYNSKSEDKIEHMKENIFQLTEDIKRLEIEWLKAAEETRKTAFGICTYLM